MHALLAKLECRHLLVVLDCCFAGAFRWSSTRHLAVVPEVIYAERYERFIRDAAWQVIASAAYDQRALDVVDGRPLGVRGEEERHSPFAAALLAALDGAADRPSASAAAWGRGDGVITATELYLYLRDCVETLAAGQHRQTPSLWPLQRHDKGEYVFLTPGGELLLDPAPELTRQNNPFRGLESFEPEHTRFFFGRRRVTAALLAQVDAQPLTLVLGSSGSGKSSLVKAGLIPTIAPEGGSLWETLNVRPGKSPLLALKNLPLPKADAALATRAVEWLAINPGRRLLLFIDQLEELITLATNREDANGFLSEVAATLSADCDRLRVVATLRSDFAPQMASGSLAPWWNAARFLVPPLSQDELREAIEGPASASVLYFEPATLVDALINEVAQTPGALPLLSFTLSELYLKYLERRASDRALTQADYDAFGGVAGSLRHRATAEYEALEEPHRATMRRVLLRMVSLEGGELARRNVPRAELVFSEAAENARVAAVLARLTEARLLVSDSEPDGTEVVEPAHDALVRGWDLLLAWSRDAQEEIQLRRLLTPAAQDWQRRGDRGGLWNSNPRLFLLRRPLRVGGDWFNSAEKRFVKASFRRRWLIRVTIAATSFAALAVLSWLGWTTWQSLQNERAAQTLAATRAATNNSRISQTLAAQGNNLLHALGYACRAAELAPPAEPRQDVYLQRLLSLAQAAPTSIINLSEPVQSAIFNATLDRVVLISAEGKLRILEPQTGQSFPAPFDEKSVDYTVLDRSPQRPNRPMFSRDGRRIAAFVLQPTDEPGKRATYLTVWDVDTGKLCVNANLNQVRDAAKKETGNNESDFFLHSLALSADGKVAAVGFLAEADTILVKVWECEAGKAYAFPAPLFTRKLPHDQNPLVLGAGWIANVEWKSATNSARSTRPEPAANDYEVRVTALGSAMEPPMPKDTFRIGSPECLVASGDGTYLAGLAGDIKRLFVRNLIERQSQGTDERNDVELILSDGTAMPASDGRHFLLISDQNCSVFSFTDDSRAANTSWRLPLPITYAAPSGDERRLNVLSPSHAFGGWEVSQRDPRTEILATRALFQLPGRIVGSAFTADERLLAAVCGDGQVFCWKLPLSNMGETLATGLKSARHGWIDHSQFVDDTHALTAANEGNASFERLFQFWELEPSRRALWRDPLRYVMPFVPVEDLAFDLARGRFAVASGASDSTQLRMHDLWTGASRPAPALRNPGNLAFMPDGRLAYAGPVYRGHRAGIVALDPMLQVIPEQKDRPGKLLVVCANPEFVVTTPEDAARESERVRTVLRTADGKGVTSELLFPSDDAVTLADGLFAQAMDICTEGETLRVTARGGAGFNFPLENVIGRERQRVSMPFVPPSLPTLLRDEPPQRAHIFLPGARSVAVARGSSLGWWELATGEPLAEPFWHESWVAGLALSSDGRHLLTMSREGTVRRWPAALPTPGPRDWLPGLGEALTGLEFKDGSPPSVLPPLRFRQIRESVLTRLEAAEARGDESARQLIRWLRR